MTLNPGARLGPYEIVRAIGAGGMGDVYKAKDTRLDRTVAIKIVRTDFSERFEREAKSISALNHPNICTLHDVGNQDGTAYLVMEFVDGAPIAGPLPIADVLKYGTQICDALEAAHKKSIVHRDLKPANILATKSGIKLLDFGLAKLRPGATPGNDATVAALTGAHTIIGTPQYMSPEQIEGREADARSDIFALGCVLYELITGKRAFEGKTVSNTMAAILATEPRKISELTPITPAALEWVVARCLEKDPDNRWQSARDVALQLKWVGDHATDRGPGAETAGAAPTSRRALMTGVTVGVAVAGVAAALWIWTSSRSSGGAVTTGSGQASLSASTPAGVRLLIAGAGPSMALSPDGRTVAFVGVGDNEAPAIYRRSIDSFETVKIPGTEASSGPVFSPNGQWIAFAAGGQLKKIPVEGGAPVVICPAPGLRGAAWLNDDTIALSPTTTGSLMKVSALGGATPTPLTKLDASQHEKTHRSPMALPGGKALVFIIGSNEIATYDEARIVAMRLDNGEMTELVKGGHSPVYSPTGHLLYVRDSTVFAVEFDPATLKTSGSPRQVLKNIAALPAYGTAEFAVAPTGALIYALGGVQAARASMHTMDKAGKIEAVPVPERDWASVRVSRDGRRLTFSETGANNVQWAYSIEEKQLTRLTLRFDVENGVWTNDGSRVTFWSGSDVRNVVADGSGADEVLISAAEAAGRMILPGSWSDDGQTLSVMVIKGQEIDIGLYSTRNKKLTMIVASRFRERFGQISPDGKWLAFNSDVSGRVAVYVRPVDGSGAPRQVPNDATGIPQWTANGRKLMVGSPRGMFEVAFTPGSPPTFGKPEYVFSTAATLNGKNVVYVAASPDGSKVILLIDSPRPPLTEIRVVTDATQLLTRTK